MRFPPAHAAPRDTAPPPKRRSMPKLLRTVLSIAIAATFGLGSTVMVAAPAEAAPSDYLTIADAGNYEGNAVTFTATYTGSVPAAFSFTTSATGNAVGGGTNFVTIPTSSYFGSGTVIITFPAASVSSPATATVSVGTTSVAGATADMIFSLVATPTGGGQPVTATGTIWDLTNATPQTFTFLSPSTVSESQSTVTVTATLDALAVHDITIPVSTLAGTAVSTGAANRDYSALPQGSTIVIPTGQLSGSIAVSLWDDSVYEGVIPQNFTVVSSTAVGVTGTETTANIGIVDNDAAPTVSIGDAPAVAEGANLVFPITLSSLSDAPLTVSFTTATGTDTGTLHGATASVFTGTVVAGVNGAANDFLTVPHPASGAIALDDGVVTIPPLNWSVNKLVATTGADAIVEGTEVMSATLSAPGVGLTLGTPITATGTITDASTGPPVLKTDMDLVAGGTQHEFAEGVSGEVVTYIPVSVDASATRQTPLIINYSFTNGTATNGVDYRGTSGTLTVPTSTTTNPLPLQIPVTIIGDTLYEGVVGETFNLVLASSNGTIDPASLVTPTEYTILENVADDIQRTWTTGDISVVEGNSGTATAKVPVTMSGAASGDVIFTASFTGTNSATETGVSSGTTVGDNDYDLPTLRTVTIPAGSTTGYLDIAINSDAVYERDEAFTVDLATVSTLVNSTVTADVQRTSRVTIANDDLAPVVSFNTATATEGSTIRVTGTTTGLSQYPYDVGLTFGPAATSPATKAVDYELPSNYTSTVTLPPTYSTARGTQGAFTTTVASPNGVEVYLTPDDIDEATESFVVTATETTAAPTGIVTTTGTYRISDDPADLPPTASISDETIKETDESVDVTVSLAFTGDTKSSTQDFSLSYYTVDGSAVEPEDYTETRGTLTIPAGTLTKKINVPIKEDNRAEPAQNFFVKIGTPGPTGATLGKYSGEVMIGASTGTTDPDEPDSDAPTLKSLASFRLGAGPASLSGKAGAGATVELWGRNYDSDEDDYAKITQTTASSTGAFAFHPALTTHGMYFMAKSDDMSSAAVRVFIREDPDIAATSASRRTVRLTVTGDPKLGGLQAKVFRVNAGGSLTLVGSGRLTSAGTFTKTLTGLRSGRSYTYKSYIMGNGARGVLTGYSTYTKTVRVR